MDRSPTTKEAPEEHTYNVQWDICNLNLLLDLCYELPVFSHSIRIFHHGLSFWRLGLNLKKDPLEFFVLRLPYTAEEHDKIFVRFKVCLVNAQDEVYFKDVSDNLTYHRASRNNLMNGQSFILQPQLRSKIFIDKNLLEFHDDKLILRCEMKVSVNVSESNERNSTDDLYYLHCDLDLLYNDEEFHNIILHMRQAHFGLNVSILRARLPTYESLVHEYSSVLKSFATGGRKEPQCPCPLESSKPRHVLHIDQYPLALALFNVWSREPPDPYIQQVQLSSFTIVQSLTPVVCKALISYLYIGSVVLRHQQDAVHLSNIARCLFLSDLVHKLEGRPSGCHSVTKVVHMRNTFRFDFLKLFHNGGELNYGPIVKTLTLSDPTRTRTKTLILTLRLIRPSEVVTLECRFPQIKNLPTFLVVTLTVRDCTGNMLKTFTRKHNFWKDEPWCPNVYIRKEDLTFKDVECLFHAVCHKDSQLTFPAYERFTFDSDVSPCLVWSLRHLSCDLLNSFNNRLTCDVVLVAQGQTLPAHIYILCCRSDRFMRELSQKLNRGHTITHLVPGVEYRTLVEMVKYLYTADLDLQHSHSVENLLAVAEDFGVDTLVNTCKSFLGIHE